MQIYFIKCRKGFSNSNAYSSTQIICHYCNKPNHIALNCCKKAHDKASFKQVQPFYLLKKLQTLFNNHKPKWLKQHFFSWRGFHDNRPLHSRVPASYAASTISRSSKRRPTKWQFHVLINYF